MYSQIFIRKINFICRRSLEYIQQQSGLYTNQNTLNFSVWEYYYSHDSDSQGMKLNWKKHIPAFTLYQIQNLKQCVSGKLNLLSLVIFLGALCQFFLPGKISAQNIRRQYFDGADTLAYNALFFTPDSQPGNIWQIGAPDKILFKQAYTIPGALVTDLWNSYPVNNTSVVYTTLMDTFSNWWSGILALRWSMFLNTTQNKDFLFVDFTVDKGQTWQNALDNPNIYNFFGFDTADLGVHSSGRKGFTGTTPKWRDIWLCFASTISPDKKDIKVRFSFVSDSIPEDADGCMLDNFVFQHTYVHTLKKDERDGIALKVYPNPTQDRLYIEPPRYPDFENILLVTLRDVQGKILKEWRNLPPKYFLSLSDFPEGNYIVSVKTENREENHMVQILK